jgi:hypothetical protein
MALMSRLDSVKAQVPPYANKYKLNQILIVFVGLAVTDLPILHKLRVQGLLKKRSRRREFSWR